MNTAANMQQRRKQGCYLNWHEFTVPTKLCSVDNYLPPLKFKRCKSYYKLYLGLFVHNKFK